MSDSTFVWVSADPAGARQHDADQQHPRRVRDGVGQRRRLAPPRTRAKRPGEQRGEPRRRRSRSPAPRHAEPTAAPAAAHAARRRAAARRRSTSTIAAKPGGERAGERQRRCRSRAGGRSRAPSAPARAAARGSPSRSPRRQSRSSGRPSDGGARRPPPRGATPARLALLVEAGLELDRVVHAEADQHRQHGDRGHRQRGAGELHGAERDAPRRQRDAPAAAGAVGGCGTPAASVARHHEQRGDEQQHDRVVMLEVRSSTTTGAPVTV